VWSHFLYISFVNFVDFLQPQSPILNMLSCLMWRQNSCSKAHLFKTKKKIQKKKLAARDIHLKFCAILCRFATEKKSLTRLNLIKRFYSSQSKLECFVHGALLSSIMSAREAGAHPSWAPYAAGSQIHLPNFRPLWKNVSKTNTLAYFAPTWVRKIKEVFQHWH